MDSKLFTTIKLSRLLPISHLQQNINAISTLIYNDDDVLDTFLQKIEQPLIIQNEQGGYICCEYNRDGDSYRKPGTTEYFPNINSGYVPRPFLLKLETSLNNIFKVYTKFYYTPETNMSVYCYDMDLVETGSFAVAVWIKNWMENDEYSKGVWEAINWMTVTVDGTTFSYSLISSVNVCWTAPLESGINSKIVISGSMTKSMEREYPKVMLKEESDIIQFHIEKIGGWVEDLETIIRNEIDIVYFKKTDQIIGTARFNGRREDNIHNMRNVMSNV